MNHPVALQKTLGFFTIWGLGVGYVISGMYFGWNLGLPQAGSYGFLIATAAVSVMYIAFISSYAELACAMPKAGGAFVYATQAFGPKAGFVTGIAQLIEFVFAPPAISVAIGAYFSLFFENTPALFISIVAYVIFTALNIYGVRQSAIFELFVTVFAVLELFVFIGITAPHFSFEAFSRDPLPNGIGGIFAAIPFAIWFYLAIEGIANIAEESRNPQKDISRGFFFAMATLLLLALLVFFSSVGVNGWQSVVYPSGSTEASDSPLPLALLHVVGEKSVFYHLLISIGLFGLVASFHGIILAASRAMFEMGRVGFLPSILGTSLENRKTPAAALFVNMILGIAALLTGRTGEIIILAVFGALTLYVMSMLSFFRLRQKEPYMKRPFVAPFVPWAPLLALVLSLVFLISMCVFYFSLACLYFTILAGGFLYYLVFVPRSVKVVADLDYLQTKI